MGNKQLARDASKQEQSESRFEISDSNNRSRKSEK